MEKNNLNNKRIIVNKYTDLSSDINESSFYEGYGEFIISIEKGKEGVYIKNAENEIVKIGVEEDFLINLFNKLMETSNIPKTQDLSETQYQTLLEEGKVTINEGDIEKTIIYNSDVYYMIYEDDEEV